MIRFRVLLAVFAVTTATGAMSAFGQCTPPVPPSPSAYGGYGPAWSNAYASWCSSCGGSYDRATHACTPGANWRGAGSGPRVPATQSLANTAAITFANTAISSFISGLMAGLQNQAQEEAAAAQSQEQMRAQQQALQAARQAEEERRRAQEWEAARQRILGGLRSVGESSALVPRDPSTPATAPSAEAIGPFSPDGVRLASLQPRDVSGIANLTPAQRAACAHDYLREANRRAQERDREGAVAFSTQARQVMNGEATPSRPCTGPGSSVPEVGNPVVVDKKTHIMSALYKRAIEQFVDYKAIHEKLLKTKADQQQAQQRAQQANDAESRAAFAEADRLVREQTAALDQARRRLDETTALGDRVQRGAVDYDQIIQQLNLAQH